MIVVGREKQFRRLVTYSSRTTIDVAETRRLLAKEERVRHGRMVMASRLRVVQEFRTRFSAGCFFVVVQHESYKTFGQNLLE